jgi:hypothetical protein
MKNAVFWDLGTQFVAHKEHSFSATEPSRLMVCKIWGFHGGDYEECCSLEFYAVCEKNRRFGGTSVLARATLRNTPADGILHSHCREKLKSYKQTKLHGI